MRFVTEVKSGQPLVKAPIYSHEAYDILPDEYIEVRQPDILILEGLNVLQTGPTLMVSDLFDFSIYVDAKTSDIEHWYIERFLKLRDTAFQEPGAHFAHYAGLDDAQATYAAREIWQSINLPNLVEPFCPRGCAHRLCCARITTTPFSASACASSNSPGFYLPKRRERCE